MRRAFLLLALLVVGALPLVSWPVTPQQEEEVLPGTARRSIYAAYDTLGSRWQTTLLLNNTTRLPIKVAPTVYSLDGAGIPLPLVQLEAHEHRRVDFREWIAPLGKDYQRGSLRLQFDGVPFGLGAILSSVHEEKSQVVEAVLHSALGFKSSQLEAVWFAPGRDARVTVAVLNITDHSLNATVSVTGEDGGLLEERIVPLAPHQARFLDLRGASKREKQRVGGVSIRHGGQGGAIFAQGFVLDPSEGMSYSIPFTDPATLAAAKFEGAGVLLGAAGGHGHSGMRFHGRLLLRNISQAPLTAEAILQKGEVKSTLASISLEAGESRKIEVPPGAAPQGDAAIGITIPHTGKPGDLIAQWFSTEEGGMVVETPLRSIGPNEHVGGNNPFLLTGDYNSVTYIKNTGDENARVVAWIQHEGGQFMLGLKDVPAGGTLAIDIGKLRDEQTPDVHGEKLPPDVTQGHINWRWFDGPPIVGRTNVMSRRQSIASNRSCSTCLCSPINVWLRINPDPIQGNAGGSKSVSVIQFEEGCSGSLNSFPLPPNQVGWFTFDPSVALPDGQGNVGLGLGSAGSTVITVLGLANISEFVQTGEFTADGEPVGECQPRTVGTSGFADVRVKPVINSISPGRGLIGNTTAVTINGQGFGASPSVQAGTGITVNVTSASNTQIQANFVVAANAPGGNHSVMVTAGGQTSNSVNFFVQVPSKLVFLNHPVAPNGIGPLVILTDGDVVTLGGTVLAMHQCGVYRNKLVELVDQDQPPQPIEQGYTITETFSDFQGNFGTLPPNFTINVTPNGAVADNHYAGRDAPNCLGANENHSFRQRFFVTIGSSAYNLSTVFQISKGRFSGEHRVDISTVTP